MCSVSVSQLWWDCLQMQPRLAGQRHGQYSRQERGRWHTISPCYWEQQLKTGCLFPEMHLNIFGPRLAHMDNWNHSESGSETVDRWEQLCVSVLFQDVGTQWTILKSTDHTDYVVGLFGNQSSCKPRLIHSSLVFNCEVSHLCVSCKVFVSQLHAHPSKLLCDGAGTW